MNMATFVFPTRHLARARIHICALLRRQQYTSESGSPSAHDHPFFSSASNCFDANGDIRRVQYPSNHYTYYIEPSEYSPSLQEESTTNSQLWEFLLTLRFALPRNVFQLWFLRNTYFVFFWGEVSIPHLPLPQH